MNIRFTIYLISFVFGALDFASSQDVSGFNSAYNLYYAKKNALYGSDLVRMELQFSGTDNGDFFGKGFLVEGGQRFKLLMSGICKSGDSLLFILKGPGNLVRKGKVVKLEDVRHGTTKGKMLERIRIEDKGFGNLSGFSVDLASTVLEDSKGEYVASETFLVDSKGKSVQTDNVYYDPFTIHHFVEFMVYGHEDLKQFLLANLMRADLVYMIKSMGSRPELYSAQKVAQYKVRLNELDAMAKQIESGDY